MVDLHSPLFTDSERARVALEALRWPDGPVCPHCKSTAKIASGRGRSHRAGLYRCGSCTRQFTVTVDTALAGSKVPLNKWWLAAHLLSQPSDEVSINRLHRKLGVTYKTAWFMSHRLRSRMKAAVKRTEQATRRSGSDPLTALPQRTARLMSVLITGEVGPDRQDATAREKRRDPGSTREMILEVACSQMARFGREGLSLTRVAQIAGVNRGTAYLHFKTRDKLVQATTEWVSEMLYQAVYGDSRPEIERFVDTLNMPDLNDRIASFALRNPELCRVWLIEILASPDPTKDRFWREYAEATERWVKTKYAQPNIDHEVVTIITLAGHFLWPLWVQAHVKGPRDEAKLAHRFTNELLRLSMYGSARPQFYPDVINRLKEAI
jgi:AcrR family transcriptional regulator/transposase-like protein